MNCPCETCLMRIPCKTNLVRRGNRQERPYLVIEYTEKCPYVLEYFGTRRDGTINYSHEKINKMCKIFGVVEGKHNNFIWFVSSLGL